MTIEKYNQIKEKYGQVCSFAIWLEDNKKCKRITEQSWNMDPFTEPNLAETIDKIRTNIIFVGLNVSRTPVSKDPNYKENCFVNFHSGNCDYRLMKAFFELPNYYGAYMTDIYKYTNKSASEVSRYYKKHPDEEKEQFKNFQEEIEFISEDKPTLFIISGKDALEAFKRFDKNNKYNYVAICHYSKDGGSTKSIVEKLKQ